MQEIDKISGLPKDLFDINTIAKEQQKIKIVVIRRRFSKVITIVSGFEDPKTAKEMGKEMKKKFACGGTTKGTEIELQGDHLRKAKQFLLSMGYNEELIDA
ncbi:MAG: stress response translation initiation inhibitor YciH [archaeon]|jgi:translation initiation factor 1